MEEAKVSVGESTMIPTTSSRMTKRRAIREILLAKNTLKIITQVSSLLYDYFKTTIQVE